jgi:predicted transcriptional regulator
MYGCRKLILIGLTTHLCSEPKQGTMQCIANVMQPSRMKTATFPPLRTTPQLRQAVEQSLAEGESLSSFVEQAIRESVSRRQHQQAFITRGLHSRESARSSGTYVSAAAVVGKLEHMLQDAKAQGKARS